MKQSLRVWATLATLLAARLTGAPVAHAEGSKQLTPNTGGTTDNLTLATNTRAGFLTHNAVGTGSQDVSISFLKPKAWGADFSADHRMLVRLQPNEKLHYGVRRFRYVSNSGTYGDLVLTLRYGNTFNGAGTIVKQNTLGRNTASAASADLLTPQAGVIETVAQARSGPNALNASGYVPLTYTNTTGSTQDFWVEFTQTYVDGNGVIRSEFNDTGAQASFNDLGTPGTYDRERRSEYDLWDFTVEGTDGLEKQGRLYSKFWAFSAGVSGGTQFENRLSSAFAMYSLIQSTPSSNQYFVKQIELAGLRPLVFSFVSNSFGSESGTNNTTFAQRRQSRVGDTGYPEYPGFVNNPDPALWPSAPIPVFSRTQRAFCADPTTNRGSVAFTTTSAESGSTTILIDLDGNGIQSGNDVVLEQSVVGGVPKTTVWDGRDKNGTVVQQGIPIKLSFVSNGSPVNFPLYDVEGNPDGLRVQNIRPSVGNNVFFDRLYWDDTQLTTISPTFFPATRPAPDQSNQRLDGVISTDGVHRWGDATNTAGDNFTVNTWTYGFISAAAETSYTFAFKCDFDQDGIRDQTDIDDDNDGIPDLAESYGQDPQSLSNSAPIYLDAAYVTPGRGAYKDINQDGLNDYFDLDLDGVPNHFDSDSDGDGLTDAIEANRGLAPTNYVAATGRISGGVDTNGMPNSAETAGNGVSNFNSVALDTDGDGVVDRFDKDSDNDGIPDLVEIQSSIVVTNLTVVPNVTIAANGNGQRAYNAPTNLDTDGDGIDNAFDPDNGGVAILYAWNSGVNPNNDPATAVTRPDYLDVDSDNDGITDAVENNGGALPANMTTSGIFTAAAFVDVNKDGLNDNILLSSFTQGDRDTDGVPNFRDLDSDNDGIPDILEASGGILPTGAAYAGRFSAANATGTNDTDNDGLVNLFDSNNGGTPIANGNFDGDALVNYLDNDSDGDGISDMREANLGNLFSTDVTNVVNVDGRFRVGHVQANDADGDGMANDVDSNVGGNPAFADPATNGNRIILDTDGDGRVDYLDLDSDNDGILDNREAQSTAAYRVATGVDTDGDGLDNAYDGQVAGAIAPVNSDAGESTAVYDYRDTDSDNDNAAKSALPIFRQTADWSEGFDSNLNGFSGDEILAKARQFATGNSSKASYYPVTSAPNGNASTLSLFLQDANSNGIPNFLEPGNLYYHDDNFNGLVDIYDPAYGGAPSIGPKRVASQADADFRTATVATPLPVALLDFQVQAIGTDAVLRWATAQESDNAGFDIERSADGKAFAKMSFVDGQGTTSQRTDYVATDKNIGLRGSTWFYRLRQVDRDGTASFSPVREVSFGGANGPAQLLAYPNPAHMAVRVMVVGTVPTSPLQVFDALGRLVLSQPAPVAGAETVLPLTNLPSGIYVLRCGSLSQRITVE